MPLHPVLSYFSISQNQQETNEGQNSSLIILVFIVIDSIYHA